MFKKRCPWPAKCRKQINSSSPGILSPSGLRRRGTGRSRSRPVYDEKNRSGESCHFPFPLARRDGSRLLRTAMADQQHSARTARQAKPNPKPEPEPPTPNPPEPPF
ncbi:hypothetical protein VTH06DRAFT_1595 [Thermothelomyces fergusii]